MSDWLIKMRKWTELAALVCFARLMKFCSLITPYCFGVWAGGMLGFCAYYLAARERNRALQHLGFAFGDKGKQWIRRTARQSFMHLGKAVMECALITPHRLQRIFDLHGQEAVRNALQQGNGAIYVTGHIGNWELMAYAAAVHGFPLSVVAAPIRPEQVNDLITELRSRMGVQTIVRSKPGAVRELIRVFKENRILAVLIDQDTDVEGAFVDFMGRQAWTPTAAASMAIKLNAPILFGYTYRDQHNRHIGSVEGPIDLIRTGNREKDIRANTALLTKKIEECIRRNPEQWVWMHRRWRRQP